MKAFSSKNSSFNENDSKNIFFNENLYTIVSSGMSISDSATHRKYIEESNKTLRLDIQHASELDGYVYLNSDVYYDIFGKRKNASSNVKKRLSVVKIEADNGRIIYREFNGRGAKGLTREKIALTPNSISMLTKIDEGKKIPFKKMKLSPGSYLPFYWLHPDKAIRVSFKLGLLSAILGFISLVLGCLSLFLSIS